MWIYRFSSVCGIQAASHFGPTVPLFQCFSVIIVAPVLGVIADMSRGKKLFLGFCVIGGAIATAAVSLVTKGDYLLCSLLYIIANSLWCAGNIFYDAFLPELTDVPERMDAISAAGYGVGYLGGGIALIICAGLIMGSDLIGLKGGTEPG